MHVIYIILIFGGLLFLGEALKCFTCKGSCQSDTEQKDCAENEKFCLLREIFVGGEVKERYKECSAEKKDGCTSSQAARQADGGGDKDCWYNCDYDLCNTNKDEMQKPRKKDGAKDGAKDGNGDKNGDEDKNGKKKGRGNGKSKRKGRGYSYWKADSNGSRFRSNKILILLTFLRPLLLSKTKAMFV